MANETRIDALRTYLLSVIDEMVNDTKYQINADMLSLNVGDYSIDRIPTQPNVNKWIIGTIKKRDLYSFRSRKAYSQDTINNLENIGFFEAFEEKITENNNKQIWPNIEGIEKIECLNTGSMNGATTNSAEFDIQIQITYRKEE